MTDQEIAKAMNDYRRELNKKNRKDALRILFTGNQTVNGWRGKEKVAGWDCNFIDESLRYKVICWLKAVICVLLNRTRGSYLDHGSDQIIFWNVYPGGGEYGGECWTGLWVTGDLFSNWQVCITEDSSV